MLVVDFAYWAEQTADAERVLLAVGENCQKPNHAVLANGVYVATTKPVS